MERANSFFQKQKVQEKSNKLGEIVSNVRDHVKQSADGLLGPENKRKDASEITVSSAGSKAWKDNKEKVVFPESKITFD